LQCRENVPCIETMKPEIGVTRMATDRGTVRRQPVGIGTEECYKPVPEPLKLLSLLRSPSAGEKNSRTAQARTERQWHCAGPKTVLLPATVNQGLEGSLKVAAHVQRTNPLRTVHLVSREADQVGLCGQVANPHAARCLRGIAVKGYAVSTENRRQTRHVLNRPDLVIHRHHGYDEHIIADLRFQIRRRYHAVPVHGNGLHDEILPRRERPGRGEDALVLNGADENAIPARRRSSRQTEQGEVVGLGGTGSEDDLVGVGTDQARDGVRCLLDGLRGPPPDDVVGRVRIAEALVPVWGHPLHDPRVDRGCRLIVGVDGLPVAHCHSGLDVASRRNLDASNRIAYCPNWTQRPARRPMLRGPLYEDEYRPKLSGHETFPLRYGWLKKAFDAVATGTERAGGKSIFLADDAIARFGVGRNMVASMRHWAVAAGVIEETSGTPPPTELGRRIFADDGLDPYMEFPATTWLVHWCLCGNPQHTTWFWAFGHYSSMTFERDALVQGIWKLKQDRRWPRAAATTIGNDVKCFVRSYVRRPASAKASYEDALESPLTELGLIRPAGRRDGFRFVRGQKPTLGAGVFALAVTEFWDRYSAASTLSFEALAHEPGSPGRVFLLDEDALADRLLGLEEDTGGVYRWSETAGLKQLIRTHAVGETEALDFIEQDYVRSDRGEAAR